MTIKVVDKGNINVSIWNVVGTLEETGLKFLKTEKTHFRKKRA